MWKVGQTVKAGDTIICRVTKDESYLGRKYSDYQRKYAELQKLPENCHLRVIRIRYKYPVRG